MGRCFDPKEGLCYRCDAHDPRWKRSMREHVTTPLVRHLTRVPFHPRLNYLQAAAYCAVFRAENSAAKKESMAQHAYGVVTIAANVCTEASMYVQ